MPLLNTFFLLHSIFIKVFAKVYRTCTKNTSTSNKNKTDNPSGCLVNPFGKILTPMHV